MADLVWNASVCWNCGGQACQCGGLEEPLLAPGWHPGQGLVANYQAPAEADDGPLLAPTWEDGVRGLIVNSLPPAIQDEEGPLLSPTWLP